LREAIASISVPSTVKWSLLLRRVAHATTTAAKNFEATSWSKSRSRLRENEFASNVASSDPELIASSIPDWAFSAAC